MVKYIVTVACIGKDNKPYCTFYIYNEDAELIGDNFIDVLRRESAEKFLRSSKLFNEVNLVDVQCQKVVFSFFFSKEPSKN